MGNSGSSGISGSSIISGISGSSGSSGSSGPSIFEAIARMERERIEAEQRQQEEKARLEEQSRLEEERRQHEIRERQRIEQEKKELEERERKRREEERRRREQEEQERERKEHERLKELNKLVATKRREICSYNYASSPGRAPLSELTNLRLGIFGPTGSGKSCFINTCERVVRQTEKGSVPECSSGSEGTIILEEYLSELSFNLVDTRGFFNYDVDESRAFRDILFGEIKLGDVIQFAKQTAPVRKKNEDECSDWLHGAIFVVNGNDIRLKNGTLKSRLTPAREIIQNAGMLSVTVVTFEDKLKTQVAKKAALSQASYATGSCRSRTFLLTNYCSDVPGRRAETELQVMDVLKCAITMSELYVSDVMQKRRAWAKETLKGAKEGKAMEEVGRISVPMFLDILEEEMNISGPVADSLANNLALNDIGSLQTLALCWEEARKVIKETNTLKTIQAELRHMKLIS